MQYACNWSMYFKTFCRHTKNIENTLIKTPRLDSWIPEATVSNLVVLESVTQ